MLSQFSSQLENKLDLLSLQLVELLKHHSKAVYQRLALKDENDKCDKLSNLIGQLYVIQVSRLHMLTSRVSRCVIYYLSDNCFLSLLGEDRVCLV